MTWRVARSLLLLRAEVDAVAPTRSKASDGTIGDENHQNRTSDHNPYIRDAQGIGVVRALDLTHDPAGGFDAGRLAEHVRLLGGRGDNRLRYVIWNRRICSAASAWAWRLYTGPNPRTSHVHVSVTESPAGYDSTRRWGFSGAPIRPRWIPRDRLPLKKWHRDGNKKLVSKLQGALDVEVDGYFGKDTRQAVRRYQSLHDESGSTVAKGTGLVVDGIVGQKTWGALFPGERPSRARMR